MNAMAKDALKGIAARVTDQVKGRLMAHIAAPAKVREVHLKNAKLAPEQGAKNKACFMEGLPYSWPCYIKNEQRG